MGIREHRERDEVARRTAKTVVISRSKDAGFPDLESERLFSSENRDTPLSFRMSKNIANIYLDPNIGVQKKVELIFSSVINFKKPSDVILSQALHHIAQIKVAFPEIEFQKNDLNSIFRLWETQTRFSPPRPRELSNLFWAMGKLGVENPRIVNFVSSQISEAIELFNPQDLSNIVWSCATLELREQPLLQAIFHRVSESLEEFNARNLSVVLWAIAKLEQEDVPLIANLVSKIPEFIEDFEPIDLASLRWSLATFNINDPKLNTLLSEKIKFNFYGLDQLSLSNIAWSYAKMGIRDLELFELLSLRAIELKHEFSPKCLTNILWAFAKLGIQDNELFRVLSQRSQLIINDFEPLSIANLGWAFCEMEYQDLNLFAALASRTQKIIDETPNQIPGHILSTIATNFAKAHIKNIGLMSSIIDQVPGLVDDLEVPDLVGFAWAFAKLGYQDREPYYKLYKRALVIISDFELKDLACLSWAFCLGNEGLAKDFLLKSQYEIKRQGLLEPITESEKHVLNQLHIAEVICGLKESNGCHFSLEKSSNDFDPYEHNSFEADVLNSLCNLQELYPELKIETKLMIDDVLVDFVITWDSKKYVLECDGDRYHIFTDGTRFGKDQIQDKLFIKAGYIPKHILSSKWQTLNLDERQQFLIDLLS